MIVKIDDTVDARSFAAFLLRAFGGRCITVHSLYAVNDQCTLTLQTADVQCEDRVSLLFLGGVSPDDGTPRDFTHQLGGPEEEDWSDRLEITYH